MKHQKKISVVIPLGPMRELAVTESLEKQKDKLCFFIEYGTNPSANRNRGVQKAKKVKTPYIGFVNAHSILTQHWAEEVLSFFNEHPEIDIVGGPQLTQEDENSFAQASGYALSSIFGTADLNERYRASKLNLHATEKQITLANLICKKKVLDQIAFDEKIYPGEDVKFIHAAEKAGFRIAYSPSIIVYNKRRKQVSGFLGLIKQIFNYGRVRPRVEGFEGLLKKPLFFIPSIFVLYILVLPILLLFNLFFVLPLLLYWMLNILFSFYESLKNKNILAFFLLPFAFFVIHSTYGIGFMRGLSQSALA